MMAVTSAVGFLFSKETTLPYRSARYRQLSHQTAKAHREFPYDVSFLSAFQIHQLVAHSVQYRVTEDVFHVVKAGEFPESVLKDVTALQHTRSANEFRVKGWFLEREFLTALERVVGNEFVAQHRKNLLQASQHFPRCETALWTPDRGRAALSKNILATRAAQSAFLWEKWQEMQALNQTLSLRQLRLWRDIERCQEELTAPSWFVASLHLVGTDADRQTQAQTLWTQRLGSQRIADVQQRIQSAMHEIQQSLIQSSDAHPHQ